MKKAFLLISTLFLLGTFSSFAEDKPSPEAAKSQLTDDQADCTKENGMKGFKEVQEVVGFKDGKPVYKDANTSGTLTEPKKK